MDDLISREAVAEKMKYRRDYVGRPSDPDCIIADEPSVPAVPLDDLCEWLADNAYMYLSEEELDNGWSSHDPAYWEMKLTKWMEAQDAR